MLRQSMKAVMIAVALAGMVKCGQHSNPCRRSICDYLFGGYGPGPFGHGEFGYAGYYPQDNRTCHGCKIQ